MSYVEFHCVQNTPDIKQNQLVNLEFTDSFGSHSTICKMIEFGWGLDRSKIYYRFRIIKSNSNRYNVGAELILCMDFNNKNNSFYFYPYCNEVSIRSSNVETYLAKIRII